MKTVTVTEVERGYVAKSPSGFTQHGVTLMSAVEACIRANLKDFEIQIDSSSVDMEKADKVAIHKNCQLTYGSEDLEHWEKSKWETFEAAFRLARIEVLNHWELVNPYWPRVYVKDVLGNPWWLVQTHAGMVKIGWRKRVCSISWEDTKIRKVVTEDNVTKDEKLVHAYTEEKIVEYLKSLAQEIVKS